MTLDVHVVDATPPLADHLADRHRDQRIRFPIGRRAHPDNRDLNKPDLSLN
ncbi:MAG: hypothetical protein IPK58_26185 [Acidobacteria bacterium]|nr:hypothetical protein [Acidobacteriota bacterium]